MDRFSALFATGRTTQPTACASQHQLPFHGFGDQFLGLTQTDSGTGNIRYPGLTAGGIKAATGCRHRIAALVQTPGNIGNRGTSLVVQSLQDHEQN